MKLTVEFEKLAHLFPKEKAASLRGQIKGREPGPSEATKYLITLKLVIVAENNELRLCEPIPKRLSFACSVHCSNHASNKGKCSGKVLNNEPVHLGVSWETFNDPNWDGEGWTVPWEAQSPWTLDSNQPLCSDFKPKG